jgi:hypothetical protein
VNKQPGFAFIKEIDSIGHDHQRTLLHVVSIGVCRNLNVEYGGHGMDVTNGYHKKSWCLLGTSCLNGRKQPLITDVNKPDSD